MTEPAQLPIRCPRCPVRLQRVDMVKHLWLQHRLLLDGQRVREPWEVVEEWFRAYQSSGDNRQLARCFELADRIDPEQGHARVQQLLLAGRSENGAARPALKEEARQKGASLCPHCLALIPLAADTLPPPLNTSHGRLSGAGYCVEVSERGLVPRLTVETPGQVIYNGREAGPLWTRRGATVFLAGPPTLAAVVVALVLSPLGVPASVPVLLLLALALMAALFVRIRWLLAEPPLERAVDQAWGLLAPRLHATGFAAPDAAFAAGLALTSLKHGRAEMRGSALERLLLLTEKAVAARACPVGHLAALVRLSVEDAARAGADPVLLVSRHVSRCLEGNLPLSFAEHLLTHWESAFWTAGNLARLRVLVCERAFAAGFEAADLLEVGQLAPALGDVLDADNPQWAARLRLLWSVRAARPWARCGEAATVFELAEHPAVGGQRLEKCPDLLLLPAPAAASAEMAATPELLLCSRGVLFADTVIAGIPATIEVRGRAKGGYQLMVGGLSFRMPADPDRLARRLERWCHYFFRDFLPQVEAMPRGRSSTIADRLRAREARRCPECGQSVLARAGEVGLPMRG